MFKKINLTIDFIFMRLDMSLQELLWKTGTWTTSSWNPVVYWL